ncbi:1089_t:CDS:2 [Funneliformis geosporum]|uniref:1089_t:CDS:1 n=1 Tax=Funneliformis geosporum TaxID=1117311 RepID=A0A9W4SNT6_9GLOM|nr:1089_t:CDS:2 [Funneliformis geosporum]
MSSESSGGKHYLNRYYIAISRDGKYTATFDAATRHVKILKTTDHWNESYEINETIAHFKIKYDDLSIQEFYNYPPPSENLNENAKVRWSIDISNGDEKFLFIAASRIQNQYMKKKEENISTMIAKNFVESNRESRITIFPAISTNITDINTAIYCLKLKVDDNKTSIEVDKSFTKYYHNRLSGICRFAKEKTKGETKEETKEKTKKDVKSDYNLKKFILLNYNGIYSFKYNEKHKNFNNAEKYNYPKEVNDELTNKKNQHDCTNLLLSHIYKKYFIIEDNSKKVLEVYSIDKQEFHFCVAQEPQSIRIFLMEHGSRIASKSFEKFNIHKIHLIEFINSDEKLFLIVSDSTKDLKFIIWDIYDTDKVDIITLEGLTSQNLSTCFASSSGNVVLVNDEGKIISISKMIEKKSEKENIEKALQLIVGRSTIQIWHQFKNDKKKKKKHLPNKGKPFLEFIWTNGNPYNQENEENKLHITSVRFGLKYFRLVVYWYEGSSNEKENKQEKTQKMKNMESIEGMAIKIKIIEWRDINERLE